MKGLPLTETGSFDAGSPWDVLWILFVLAVIVGLIVVLLRFLAKRSRGFGMNRSLRSLGGYPLGPNKSMQIVEWNGRIYVLGVGENVSMLDAITDPDEVAALLAAYDMTQEEMPAGLPDWLRKFGQRNRPDAGSDEAAVDRGSLPSFEETLEQRLRKLAERRQRAEQLLEEPPSDERLGKS